MDGCATQSDFAQVWREGIALFDAGAWWDAHEALEPAWLRARGSERERMHVLILLAAALHKGLRQGNGPAARRLCDRARRRLAGLAGNHELALDALEHGCRAALAGTHPPPRIGKGGLSPMYGVS